MIGQELHHGGSFWSFLLSVDGDLADHSAAGMLVRWSPALCQLPASTAGRLDDLPEEYRCRFSFCCDRDGCRKRVTPPSVRFLGRKVYLGAVVILIARCGRDQRRAEPASFRVLFGVDSGDHRSMAGLLARPRSATSFWKVARARLVPVFEIVALPRRSLRHSVAPTIPFWTG